MWQVLVAFGGFTLFVGLIVGLIWGLNYLLKEAQSGDRAYNSESTNTNIYDGGGSPYM